MPALYVDLIFEKLICKFPVDNLCHVFTLCPCLYPVQAVPFQELRTKLDFKTCGRFATTRTALFFKLGGFVVKLRVPPVATPRRITPSRPPLARFRQLLT